MIPLTTNYQHYWYQKRRESSTKISTAHLGEDILLSPIQSTKAKWLTSLQNLSFDADGNSTLFSGHQPIAGANFDLPEDVCNPNHGPI